MEYVLAVDGGNTKTLAYVVTLDGAIIGIGRSGTGDIYHRSPAIMHGYAAADIAIANIEVAVTQAICMAHIRPDQLAAGVFNLAGADWPEDYELLQASMHARQFGRRIAIQNDALGILHALATDNIGVAVICGTGAATGARGQNGRIWHSSFWQTVHGSAHLGQQVIDAVIRAELGLEEPTILTQRVLTFFDRESVREVLHTLTARTTPSEERPHRHRLTELLLDAAESGDQVACRLVAQHGHALGDYVAVAARYVGIEQTAFPLVLAGGVLRHPTTLLADAITQRAREHSPDLHVVRSPLEPIIGVIFTALEYAGRPADASIRRQVMTTMPNK